MMTLLPKVAGLLVALFLSMSVAFGQTTPQTRENNQVCMDPIVGPGRGPYINAARTSGLCLACSGSSTSAVADGNLANFATIDLGVSAVGGYRISVRDSLQYYPAGNEVGFVIRFRQNGLLGLIDAALLNQFVIRTYRSNVLVESANFTSGSGLLKANVLNGSGQGKQILSFVTTQEFDEVELAYTGVATAGNAVDVYNAFEGPANCRQSCLNALLTNGESVTATSGSTSPVPLGCLLGSISGTANVVDADSVNNFETISSTVGLACTRFIQVRSATTYPAGYEAGYVIDNGDGIIGLNLLGGVKITTYLNGVPRDSLSGSSLIAASVLGSTSRVQLGFKTTQTFNSIRISMTGISVAVNLRIFNAYVVADSDNDGISDCMDRCPGGNDLIDTDGDGTPDGCDQNIANLSVTKSVSSATATVGSNVTFTIVTSRTAQYDATGVVVRDTLAPGLTYVSHTATTGTVYDPATGRWTIGSALAGPTTSVTLAITVRVDAEGVNSNVAEVIRSFETDPNSTPGNSNTAEDDIASACVSVPVRLCEGERLQLTGPSTFSSGVEWFRTVNGVTTSVATTATFSASLTGNYTYTAVGNTGCASGNCCPVILIVDPLPVPVIVASSSVICAGSNSTLSISNVAAGVTYVWNDGTVGTSITVTPNVTSVYSVSATTAAGCSNVISFTVIVNPLPVQAPIVALCGPAGGSTYNFAINPTTLGSSTTYFVTVGSGAEIGPFAYGVSRLIEGNTGSFSVVIRDAVTSCSITRAVTAPTDCPTCPPKVCAPVSIVRLR
ncbi:MAG: DUF11 domain-containing protein [Cytophagaceae bacterium]|nr:MAG: DUF11 domain-containing protein [Cytophagaceae bacterium]